MRCLIIFCILINTMFIAATDVSGIQTGNWGIENSPYVVIGDVTIPDGEELNIDPGVEVQFNGPFQIEALGMLNAQGTEEDSISFNRYPTYSGYWDELRLENESDEYEISYCIIRGADNGVNSIDAPLHLHHCHLDGNTKGIHLFAIGNPDPPDVLIEYCLIENSYENGIDIYENGNAMIQNCEITGNGMGTQYRGAIQVNIQSNGAVCSPQIINNNIHDNQKQGITCTDMFSAGTINVLIENNLIERNLTGAYFYNCGGQLINNQINDNFIPGDMNSGAGVMCYGSLSTPDIFQNMITGNYTALYIVNDANPCMGDMYSVIPQQQGENTFMNNIDANGNNNSVYVYNCSNTYTIMAENNTWDSENYDEIADTINDGNDLPSLPLVDFDPIYSPPSQLLSGTFNYEGTHMIEQWMLYLISVNYSLDQETYQIEYGSFEIDEIPQGYYFLCIIGLSTDGQTVVGSYGDWRFPEILTIHEFSQYTDLEIDVTDYNWERYFYVPRVLEEGDITLYHFVEGGFFPSAQALLYRDGDYLRYWGKPQYDNNGWYIQEFALPHPVYHKVTNLSVGDTWDSLRLYGGDELVIYQYTVTARDTIEYMDDYRECFIADAEFEDNLLEDTFVSQIGIASELILTPSELLEQNRQLDQGSLVLPPADTSFLPLALYYFAYYQPGETPTHPWGLDFAWDSEDESIMIWKPPFENIIYETYRIYADDQMIAEIPVSERQYPVPLPIVEDTDFYVTAYDGSNESETSNIITWIVPSEESEDLIDNAMLNLAQNYPNPFMINNSRSATAIDFYLPQDGFVSLNIYNIRGQKVRSLRNEVLMAGDHSVFWDGRNDHRTECASGIYYYQIFTKEISMAKKLLLIR